MLPGVQSTFLKPPDSTSNRNESVTISKKTEYLEYLNEKIKKLEEENFELLQRVQQFQTKYNINFDDSKCYTAKVPKEFQPFFKKAEKIVSNYFERRKNNPKEGTIEICDERYFLIRGSALTVEFYQLMKTLFEGKEYEAISFTQNILFDLSHNIGKADAKNYFLKMGLTDPISKLSAGPVHFAFSGWALVKIFSESITTPDDNFLLIYEHQNSFEAASYQRANMIPMINPCCSMSAGYSSGWCEESFGIKLVALEILCKARGDSMCKFIMAPPNLVLSKISDYHNKFKFEKIFLHTEIPGFFERRNSEEQTQKKVFNDLKEQHLALQSEREKVLNLLLNMFPSPIVDKMRMGEEIIAQKHENVTILFADVVDFTKISSNLDAEIVLKWLNSLFTTIDKLTDKFQLEKIKTIGDAYMVAAGIFIPREDHVVTVLKFALDLVKELHLMYDPAGNEVKMRIGICSGGPVCSGVIGKKKICI